MVDNVGYTPGTGATIAAREVTYSGDTVKAQVVGLATFAGADDAKTITDVDASNPLPTQAVGELIEAIEAMRMAINALKKTIGFALPNAQGFPIMEARQSSAAALQMSANQSGTWNIATLTNQAQVGAIAANDQIPSLMAMRAASFRRNITVT
jgi:hypothetical protein